jgi:hypothetical protein
MFGKKPTLSKIIAVCVLVSQPAFAQGRKTETLPWAATAQCKLNPSHPAGLHPDAYSALKRISADHRITQGINHSSDRGNVHDTDGTLSGAAYTGAVDISVRCLTEAQIKAFLGRLADLGFAGWYRKPGQDSWAGPPHIHAVWAGCGLKAVLRRQVESWLNGNNGLGSDEPYRFWQASPDVIKKVAALYRASN